MIERIVGAKKEEIEALRGCTFPNRTKPVVTLEFDGPINILAELKRRSPSAGFIADIGTHVIELYSKYARAISVLTDSKFFGGSMEYLSEVADQTHLPLLCKDFIIDRVQIDRAYSAGADIILLIARILEKQQMQDLYFHATSLGLACLVEVHQAEEIEKLDEIRPPIIGVNSRNLDTLQIDLKGAEDLLSRVEAPMRIAESGIKNRQHIEQLRQANGFLIGEALMRSHNLEETFLELLYD